MVLTPVVHLLAQIPPRESASALATRLASIPAVTGYEQALVDTVLRLLPGATRDRAGNAVLNLGQGPPTRLAVCPLDEPGYVVGSVRDDGYLTLRRVPGKVGPLFDQQLEGHRVTIQGRRGPVPGVVAVRSIHLTRGRTAPSENPFTVDDAFVDVGAATIGEVANLGVSVLAPVTLAKRPHPYGDQLLAAPVAGRRAACAALLSAARGWAGSAPNGFTVVAFVVEQELSQRGLATVANTLGPFDETLLVDGGPGAHGTVLRGPDPATGGRWPKLGRVSRWSLPVSYAGSAVETVSLADTEALRRAIGAGIGAAP
jgi:putative aminopeptidase FrvX